ncbi:MAG TPA: hypothetical protein VF669_18370 [Tepidisphaeraceae bacterium]|jgi:hypothetical protein
MRLSTAILLLAFSAPTFAGRALINPDQVLEIDGRKTFLIGFIMPPAPGATTPWGKTGIQELRDAGATFLRTGVMGKEFTWDNQATWDREQQWLDEAAKAGMYCMPYLREAGSIQDADREALLRKIISRFKDHPAMGAYYGFDEPQWVKHPVEPMRKAYQIIKEMDPNHPVWVNHAPRGAVEELQPYNITCDATGMDVYPISYPPGVHSIDTNREISMVGDFTDRIMRVADGEKPVWMCLQIAWSGVIKPGKTLRFPTFPQQRFMTYQAIINGARGLIYFGGQLPASLNERDRQYGWNWTFWQKVLRPVIEEIGANSPLYPALVAPASTIQVKPTSSTNLETCVREVGNQIFILACKREGGTENISLQGLPSTEETAEVMFESPRRVTIKNATLTDWFAPFDVHVYCLKRKTP